MNDATYLLEYAQKNLEHLLDDSYRNFHAKGLDYLCLKRTPLMTVKAYFFDGDVAKLPEVVMPHNHRYNFLTTVLSGEVMNELYSPGEGGWEAKTYNQFSYMTPLNGGAGFTYEGEVLLHKVSHISYREGRRYFSLFGDIHTIRIMEPETILVLYQHEDRVPIEAPTQAYSRDSKEPPSGHGLYDIMTMHHAQYLLDILKGKML